MLHSTRRSLRAALAGAVAVVGTVAMSVGGCSSSTPDPVVVLPSASANDEVVASAAPSAKPPVTHTAGTTPGLVRCGKVDCKLGSEVCCMDGDEIGACVPAGAGAKCAEGTLERRCDESADCKPDELCRLEKTLAEGCGGPERWACAPRRAPNGAPTTGEVCLSGGTCSTGACKTYGDPASATGECPAETPPQACGPLRCKAGEACCWNGKTRTGACVAADAECDSGDTSPDAVSSLYACERASECEPGLACYSNLGNPMLEIFQCRPSRCSATTLIDGPFLCDTKADCPPDVADAIGGSYMLTGCLPDNARPPGVKTCQYR